jgi:hypothetical protein
MEINVVRRNQFFPTYGERKVHNGVGIIRGIRKPMERELKYPYMVCICPVVMTLNTRYKIYIYATATAVSLLQHPIIRKLKYFLI